MSCIHSVFNTCEVLDDVFKLGLVIFIEGYFLGKEPNKVLKPEYSYLVDNV